MVLSPENPSELKQLEFAAASSEPSSHFAQIEGFLNLLTELKILERERAGEARGQGGQGGQEGQESNQTAPSISPAPPAPPAPPISSAPLDLFNDADAQLERLRDLLLPPELTESSQLTANFARKLAELEREVYEPAKSLERLLPLVAELLRLKVTESREEIVCALAPVIDKMIQNKIQQDKEAMISALAPVLPGAIAHQISNSPQEIAGAIAPAMAVAIKEQINHERDAMVDALYPVIGSMTAKYMGEAIRSIDEKLQNTFSPEGITRKIRAKLQGVSEAELILKEAMPFTVRAIFLIHKGSGLLVAEVQPSGSQLEAEMVAGMLTAIRSFVNDCISQSGDVSEIDGIDYGNSKIVLEVAGYCYLAVAIDGEPPQWFIQKLRQSLISIVQSYGHPIELFEGDPTTIPPPVKSILEGLLEITLKQQAAKPPAAFAIASLVILSLILLPWGFYQYHNACDRRLEADTASALASAPELSVYRLTVRADRGTLKLSGRVPNLYLRRRAEQIAKGVVGAKLENEIIAVNVPPDPVLVAAEVKRVTAILNQMEGVSVSAQYAAGSATVTGTVSQLVDANNITRAFRQIPGVQFVTNTVRLQPLVITTRIYFELASTVTADLPKITQLQALLKQYPEKHLRIVGHSDASGNPDEDRQLALQRARAVRDAFVLQGISRERLQVAGVVLAISTQPSQLSRYVGFEDVTRN